MPFTLSHAAAAIPFRRTRLVPSAIVAGCLAPDFAYCIPFAPYGSFGHKIPGVFVFDLPVALAFLWLFHRYAKQPLWSWMPRSFRQRVSIGPQTLPLRTFAQWGLIVLSIFIGVVTHIVWDSFTHHTYWPYRHIPFLRQIIVVPILGPCACYKILQHVSTILGLVIIWVWWHFRARSIPPRPELDAGPRSGNGRMAPLIFALIALGAGVCTAFATMRPTLSDGVVATSIVTAMSVFWFEIVIYGIIRDRRRSYVRI